MKSIIFCLLILAASPFQAVSDENQDEKQVLNEKGYYQITKMNITLQWRVKGEHLDVIVNAPTTGWVAVGFDPVRRMKGANIVIGFVKDAEVFIRDDYGVARTFHRADEKVGGKDNITDVSGSETGGSTELAFTIPLDSGNPGDKVLVPGKDYTVLLAYGSKDNFTTYHNTRRTSVKIKL